MTLSVSLLSYDPSASSSATLVIVGGFPNAVTASVGDMIVVFIAADNAGTSGANSISSVTDSAGNTYTQRSIINYDPGAANTGVTLGIYTTVVTNAITAGTITVNFSPNTTYKVAVAYKLVASTGTPAVRAVGSGLTGNEGSTSISITSSSLSLNDVIFGVVAFENLSGAVLVGDTDTTRGSWNTIDGTTSGLGTSWFGVFGSPYQSTVLPQYKTVTGAGTQTYDASVSGDNPDFAANYIAFYESAVAFDVNANSGSYSVSGTAAALLRDLYTSGDAGAYNISGSSAALYTLVTIAADVGTYEVLGTDLNFALSNRMNLETDSYLISGDDATFVRTNSIAGEAGNYAISGQNATVKTSYRFVSDAGAYAIVGSDANLRAIGRLAAETASYDIVGQDATFLGSNRIISDAGSYEITGNDISFLQERIWSVEAGSYEIVGTGAGLLTDSASVVYDIQDLYVRNFSKMPFWRAVRAKELLWPKWKF